MTTFNKVLTDAVNDFIKFGFDGNNRLHHWSVELRHSAEQSLISEAKLRTDLERALQSTYDRLVIKSGLVSKNVSQSTLDKYRPKLHQELNRRMTASATLIKLNREDTITNTLRRFAGWATSIPEGGTEVAKRREEKRKIKKDLGTLPFKERRVIIDQTNKMVANMTAIVALGNGAIGAKWHSNWKQPGYHYREDHRERDEKIYLIRDSWAQKEGYVKPINGYTDDITDVGEEVFCRCHYEYIYQVSQMPNEFITQSGKQALQLRKIS